MHQKAKVSIVLHSTFHVSAHLKVSTAHLKNELEKVAYLKPLSYGTSLNYSLHPFDPTYSCLLEFSKSSVDYSFSFSAPSEIEYTRNFLVLIAILSYLKACYDIDMSTIYPYLVEVLQIAVVISPKEEKNSAAAILKRVDELCKSNAILSKDLLSLQRRVAYLSKTIEKLSSFAVHAISNMPRLSNGKYNSATIASALGIELDTVEKALDAIENGEENGACI